MRFVGTPAEMSEGIRQSPAWAQLTAVAHTLPYDAAARGGSLGARESGRRRHRAYAGHEWVREPALPGNDRGGAHVGDS